MVREVITYPNPILRKKSRDVEVFDKELLTLLDDMNDTMQKYSGVGLAAIQVGIDLNVLIINIPIDNEGSEDDGKQLDENLIEAINPEIRNIKAFSVMDWWDSSSIDRKDILFFSYGSKEPGRVEGIQRAKNMGFQCVSFKAGYCTSCVFLKTG